MDLETAQTTTTDVIENGNSFKPATQTTTNADGTSTTLIPGPITTEEKVEKNNDVKARSMLLMALPNEHVMAFNQYKDAKTLFAAIQTRFGGNEATNQTQKTLLKQMYENFNAPSTESLDFIFNMLQKIISQLAILGENILQEDLNLQLLRSLPSEWNTHVVVWRNKPDLDTMRFDDHYNNFKIVEQEVKRTTSSSSSSSSQNMAFVSSPSSTNEVNTVYEVSTANTQVSPASTQVSTANSSDATVYAFLANQPNGSQLVHEDLEQIHEDNLEEMDLKWQLALLSMRTRRFFQKIGRKITINGSDTTGYDKSKSYMENYEVPTNMALMAFQTLRIEFNKSEFNLAMYKRGLASIEEQLVFYKKNEVIFWCQTTDKSRKGVGFVSYNVVLPPHTRLFSPLTLDLSNSGLEEFQQPEIEGYGPKTSKSVSEDISNEVRKSPNSQFVEELVSDDKSQSPRGNQRNWNNQKSQQLGSDFVMYNKACFVCGSFDHVQADCNYHQRERVVSGNNYTRVNYSYSAKKAHPSAHRNMVPRGVLMKTDLRPLNTARPTHPKTIVYSARLMSHFSKSAQSTIKRPYEIRTTLTNKNFSQKVNTAKGKFYTARSKVVNTARPNSVVVNAVRENQVNAVKASACWVWRPTKLNSASITLKRHNYVDARGRSKHMTGNMSYLSDFKEFDGGYVTFGGGAKSGKITAIKDERGIVIWNKARLVTQGHTQEECIDYDEVFALVARIEAMRLFLAYASFMGFMVYQMDVKSAFLYGRIEEEVYVCQSLGFEDPDYPDKVYKVVKVLYGLHRAPRAWSMLMTLSLALQRRSCVLNVSTSSTLMDTEKPLLKDSDGDDVDVHLYKSMIGSLMYLTSSRPDIMYLKGQPKLGLWYPRDSSFDLVAYSDSDYARASLDRKSTTGGCQFLGCRLISWPCKKQTMVATSSTEAKYVVPASCCRQVL
ncbi:ribonuclease H-like domain-containing protein [Tanacetum coccineum]